MPKATKVVVSPPASAKVTVEALPERAPEKVVAVMVLVLGLTVSPALVFKGWFPVAVLEKVKKSEALATSLARLTLLALVAVVAVVAVVALPERAPVKVVVLRLLVDGLKERPVPRLKAWFELVDEATNNGKKEALVETETVAPLLALVAVVAVAALPPMERLATGVVEATTNGAVPVETVEVI